MLKVLNIVISLDFVCLKINHGSLKVLSLCAVIVLCVIEGIIELEKMRTSRVY